MTLNLGHPIRGGMIQTAQGIGPGALDYRCPHISVTSPVILIQVRCPAGCRLDQ